MFRPEYLATFYKNGQLILGSDYERRLEANRTEQLDDEDAYSVVPRLRDDREVSYAANGMPVG